MKHSAALPLRRSKMAAQLAAVNWSATPLGDIDGWPPSLRSAVQCWLDSEVPAVLFWGPKYTQIYNDASIPLFGDKHPAAFGLSIRDSGGGFRGELNQGLDTVFSTGEPLRCEAVVLPMEGAHGRPQPTRFTFSLSALRDESGAVAGAVAIAIDASPVTAAHRHVQPLLGVPQPGAAAMQTRLRQSADPALLYAMLLDALQDGVVHSYSEGPDAVGETVLAANPCACRMVGYGEEELIGRIYSDLIDIPIAEGRNGTSATTTARAMTGEGDLRRKDGSRLPVDLTRVSTAGPDGERHTLTLLRDAAARRELEHHAATLARQRNAENLMGGIAHDFNNILTVIIGGAEFLAAGVGDSAEQTGVAESIVAAAERGAAITAQLLAYARRQPLSARSVDLNDLIGQLDNLIASTLGESIEVSMVPQPDLPWTRIDSALCGSALLNVLLNARDAMASGGRLVMSTGSVRLPEGCAQFPDVNLAPGDYVYVSCRDNGAGMTPEVRERLFEPFFTTKDLGRGTGLGMPMVQSFARQCGGDVSVVTAPGDGTTVSMLFPVLADAQADSAPSASDATAARRIGIGRTALVVEDNALVLERAAQLLKGLGFDVHCALDGREALRLFADAGPVDLLFADVVMPGGINGAQLADQLHRLNPNLKVLLTTGYWDDARVGAVSRINDFYVLPKPYNGRKLYLALKEALDQEATND